MVGIVRITREIGEFSAAVHAGAPTNPTPVSYSLTLSRSSPVGTVVGTIIPPGGGFFDNGGIAGPGAEEFSVNGDEIWTAISPLTRGSYTFWITGTVDGAPVAPIVLIITTTP